MRTLPEIANAALQLPTCDRAALMDTLQMSFEDEPMAPETLEEVKRRMAEISEGKVKTVGMEEMEKRLAKLMRRMKREAQVNSMIDKITPENRHEEVDWGPPVGREVW